MLKRVLLLEDDLFTSRLLKKVLEENDFTVTQSFDISSAIYVCSEHCFDVAILDIRLPSGSSLEWFDKLKKLLNCPIIIYTGQSNTTLELKSLEIGADDFILKERGAQILINRMERLLHSMPKNSPSKDNQNFTHILNKADRTFGYDGNTVILTKNEFHILNYIFSQDSLFASKDDLSCSIHGYGYDGWSRSLDLAVSRLRKKLEEITHGVYKLIAVRGRGYKLEIGNDLTRE
ncbi:response regulator transcription factor [Vibrio vulnificus]|nr:response regulator transcription factor [Vibrio vulnificus]ELR8771806.1 response regulator transcription factor [Vibrio vulnificus]ELV8636032.1 response regulator transcription factor [Vibrio vulnificus]